MNVVTIRPAAPSDTRQVYEWQSLPETRRFARNPAVPSWQEHERWMARRLEDEQSPYFVIELNSTPVGVLRLDRKDGAASPTYEIAIFVDPDHHGRGVAKAALSMVYPIIDNATLLATVHPDNSASHYLFRSAGFHPASEELYQLDVRNGTISPQPTDDTESRS